MPEEGNSPQEKEMSMQ